jgi:cadmium resistance protein CadD (predicted permease)
LTLGTVAEAIGTFAVTNVDDLVVLAVFFGQAEGRRRAILRIVTGQYLGFTALLAVSVTTAVVSATLLPHKVLAYFGFVPIALGVYAGFRAWRERRRGSDDADGVGVPGASQRRGPTVLHVAAVRFSSGVDNIGVYVPIFAVATLTETWIFVVVFLIGVAMWCLAARYLASHRVIAEALTRWDHIILPVVLIGIGVFILIEGGAFGL